MAPGWTTRAAAGGVFAAARQLLCPRRALALRVVRGDGHRHARRLGEGLACTLLAAVNQLSPRPSLHAVVVVADAPLNLDRVVALRPRERAPQLVAGIGRAQGVAALARLVKHVVHIAPGFEAQAPADVDECARVRGCVERGVEPAAVIDPRPPAAVWDDRIIRWFASLLCIITRASPITKPVAAGSRAQHAEPHEVGHGPRAVTESAAGGRHRQTWGTIVPVGRGPTAARAAARRSSQVK